MILTLLATIVRLLIVRAGLYALLWYAEGMLRVRARMGSWGRTRRDIHYPHPRAARK